MRITLVGSGNTGTVLGKLMLQSGHEIVRVISRSSENAQALAKELRSGSGILTDQDYGEADIYVVCLADYAMNNIQNLSALKGKFIVHTAGALSIEVFKEFSDRYGVLYPLQSLSKLVDRLPQIPLMIDGNTPETLTTIRDLAQTISTSVTHATDQQRLAYHIAAVFGANFTNHMYALAELYCKRENIEFANLLPIINEIHQRVNQYSPFQTQTGPAVRNDVFTITKHLHALNKYDELKYMYLKLTESIVKTHTRR